MKITSNSGHQSYHGRPILTFAILALSVAGSYATTPPAAPDNFTTTSVTTEAVTISWDDLSDNEDGFIIRRRAIATQEDYSELARTGPDTTTFTDTDILGNTTYTYRVRSFNEFGETAQPNPRRAALAETPARGGRYTYISVEYDGVYYFAYEQPDRLERFDLQTRQWIEPIPLTHPPRSVHVGPEGIFVAFRQRVVRIAENYSNEIVATTRGDLGNGQVFLAAEKVFVWFDNESTFKAYDASTLEPLGDVPALGTRGFSSTWTSPDRLTVFATSSSGISHIHFDESGAIVSNATNYDFDRALQGDGIFVYPNQKRLLSRRDGNVANTSDLTLVASDIASYFNDVAFFGDDIPIVSIGNNAVAAYSNTLQETGRIELSYIPESLSLVGNQLLTFDWTGKRHPGIDFEALPLTALNLDPPGQPVSPRNLEYAPDNAFVGTDGILYLPSALHLSLFRWSVTDRRYIDTIPLDSSPKLSTYSPDLHRVYFTAGPLEIAKVDLASPSPHESPHARASDRITSLVSAGPYLYVDEDDSPSDHRLFAADGSLLSVSNGHDRSVDFVWNPRQNTIIGAGFSSLRLHRISNDGILSPEVPVQLFGDVPIGPPIRTNPDGNRLLTASGTILDTRSWANPYTLPVSFTDALYRDGSIITLSGVPAGTEIQRFPGPDYTPGSSLTLAGSPVRILECPGGLLAITVRDRSPSFALLDPDTLDLLYQSPRKPDRPTGLQVIGFDHRSIELGWIDQSAGEDSFRVDYRTTGSNHWQVGPVVPTGATRAVIADLLPSTPYELRVVAANEIADSEPSTPVNTRTKTAPLTPRATPYHLTVSGHAATWLDLRWSDHSDNETGFRVYQSSDGSSPGTVVATLAADTTFLALTSLLPGTAYTFRIQAFNSSGNAALSHPLEVTTLASDGLAPTSNPSEIQLSTATATSLSITWTDRSPNEDGFILTRNSPASPGTFDAIARLPRNTTAFTDTGLEPDHDYAYQLVAYNQTASLPAGPAPFVFRTLARGGRYTGTSQTHDGVSYFALADPDRIERFSGDGAGWLPPLPLASSPEALWVDALGTYVASGTSLLHFPPGSTTPSEFATLPSAPSSYLFSVPGTIYAVQAGQFFAFDQTTGTPAGEFSRFTSPAGFSSQASPSRLFAIDTLPTPASLVSLTFGPDSTPTSALATDIQPPLTTTPRTFPFPDGTRVITGNGAVYNTVDLSPNRRIGDGDGDILDVAFLGTDTPVVLQRSHVIAYDNRLLETGRTTLTLPTQPIRITATNGTVSVFYPDPGAPHGIRAAAVDPSPLRFSQPEQTKDASDLPFVPDGVFVAGETVVHLLSKSHLSLFRWSLASTKYLPPIDLQGTPGHATYSETTGTAYLGYADGTVTALDLASPTPRERPYATFAPPLLDLLATTGHLYVVSGDPAPGSALHTLLDLSTAAISSQQVSPAVSDTTWSHVNSRLYSLSSASGTVVTSDVTSDGTLQPGPSSPPLPFALAPLRASPDGRWLALADGTVLNALSLDLSVDFKRDSLGLTWLGKSLYTTEDSGGRSARVLFRDRSFSLASQAKFGAGRPSHILAVPGERLLLVTIDSTTGIPSIDLISPELQRLTDTTQASIVEISTPVTDPTTGLLQQTLRIRNHGSTPIHRFAVSVSLLHPSISLYNASGSGMEGGTTIWWVEVTAPLAAGAHFDLHLEYLAEIPPPETINPAFSLAASIQPATPATALPFAISRVSLTPESRLALHFPSVPGRRYLVQSRQNNTSWIDSNAPAVRAAGTTTRWLSAPRPDTGTHLYRVIELSSD